MSTVSVVIPSRGGAQRLPRLVSTLAAQSFTDWEAIVVIDGDIDDSAAVVGQYSHLPVRAIVFPENRGRVAALNAGFAAAGGEILVRADDDFELDPGHLAAFVAAHRARECGAVGLPRNIAVDNAYMRAYGSNADRASRQAGYQTPAAQRWRLWGGNVSVTRELYDRLGGYDPRYQGYGWEDLDFGYRLQQLGVEIEIVPGAEVGHHMASVTTRIRALRSFDSGAARANFDRIHGAGASGPARPPRDSSWNRLINSLADRINRGRTERLAGLVDRLLPVLPRPLARKAVAAVVEAAAAAGYRAEQEPR